ncbi:hypothetical protein IE077_001892 [Cardiosporidium cionae]|uniref:DNA/RNA-binding protein Alba-like domain-containing protein n=1 Tax=Cardiosporidium cionae TaxID=476202 RepID=A0ABQ7JFY2_9APIC|nr:hypothetical protein IE077_001892 [Cardiosporidium cionae]|eukprot:KAF8822935.1 hypothetical protein IE077_001892 [Cardiosporidium cionae]
MPKRGSDGSREVSPPLNYLQISCDTKPASCLLKIKALFSGAENHPPFDEVCISGLGHATANTADVALTLKAEGKYKLRTLSTGMYYSPRMNREVPQMTFVFVKPSGTLQNGVSR